MTDKKIAFEFVEQFDFLKLNRCYLGQPVFSRVFVTRHGDYAFKWRLHVIPKYKCDDKEVFGLFLCNKDVVKNATGQKFGDINENGEPAFLPSVASLMEKGLVVGNVVKIGVKIILKVSDFNPLRWLPMPLLTPNDKFGVEFFINLNTDNDLGTDFVLVVGETKKELRVNRLLLSFVPFFDRMFSNNACKENKEGVLQMPMHTVDAVIEALRFVYVNAIGDNLTRFLPSILALASEWQRDHLMTAIERDMVKKLQADQLNAEYDIAAEYLELAAKYRRKVVRRMAIFKLIDVWPQFLASPKGQLMKKELKDEVVTMMQAAAVGGGVFV